VGLLGGGNGVIVEKRQFTDQVAGVKEKLVAEIHTGIAVQVDGALLASGAVFQDPCRV